MKKRLVFILILILGLLSYASENKNTISINEGVEVEIVDLNFSLQRIDEEIFNNVSITSVLSKEIMYLAEGLIKNEKIKEIVFKSYNLEKLVYKIIIKNITVDSFNESIYSDNIYIYSSLKYEEKQSILFDDGKEIKKLNLKIDIKNKGEI